MNVPEFEKKYSKAIILHKHNLKVRLTNECEIVIKDENDGNFIVMNLADAILLKKIIQSIYSDIETLRNEDWI